MKNKILKLFFLLAIVLPACINFTACDYGTYNIYPESTNESSDGTDNETDNESDNGTDDENANGNREKSSEMLSFFKTSQNIGRPIKLKIKISAEKKLSQTTLNYYPLLKTQTSTAVYCHDNFSVIDPPEINFGGTGNPKPWSISDNSITFKIKIESDIPPLDDLPIYFAGRQLGSLKGFTREAEFTIGGSASFSFNNYLSSSYTELDIHEDRIDLQADVGGGGGESEIIKHVHTITISGDLVNAQSPERMNINLSGKNILEDFPLVIGEVNIPLENVSLKFLFNTSITFSGKVTKANTNSCCYQALPDEGGSGIPTGTTYTDVKNSAEASWDFSYETEKEPILLAPISILVEEENTESSSIDAEADKTQSI